MGNVVDTNVLVVANGKSSADNNCIDRSIDTLISVRETGISIDNILEILQEYMRYSTLPDGF